MCSPMQEWRENEVDGLLAAEIYSGGLRKPRALSRD